MSNVSLYRSLLCVLSVSFSSWAQPQAAATAAPAVTVDRLQVSFANIQSGGSASQTINVNSTSAPVVVVDVSNSPSWLQVSPSGILNLTLGSPTALMVRANTAFPSVLAPGTYAGSFVVSAQGSQATVMVNMTVSAPTLLGATPSLLNFTVQTGTSTSIPSVIPVSINGIGPAYTVTAATQGGRPWLTPVSTAGTTPSPGISGSAVNVGVNATGLLPGTYTGQVLVQDSTSPDSISFAVVLTVTPDSGVTVTPSNLLPFLYQITATPSTAQLSQQVALTSATSFAVSLSPPVPWLTVSGSGPALGSTGGMVTLTAVPGNLQPATYYSNVVINAGGGAVSIPVMLIIGFNPLLQVSNNALIYSTTPGQAPPADQTVQVTSYGSGSPVAFVASSSATWLSATASSIAPPATVTVHVNTSGLAAGGYFGIVTLKPSNGDPYTLPIYVRLTVGAAQ